MEDLEKNIEYPENQEEVNLENDTNTSEKMEKTGEPEWYEKLGETTISDACKYLYKWIKTAGDWKLKYVAYVVGSIFGLIIAGLLGYHIIFPFIVSAFRTIWGCFSMVAGLEYEIDDFILGLFLLCLVISVFVAYNTNFKKRIVSFLFGLLYFVILFFTLKYWSSGHNAGILGGISFGIFFVLVPVLLWINNSNDVEHKTDETEENAPELHTEK